MKNLRTIFTVALLLGVGLWMYFHLTIRVPEALREGIEESAPLDVLVSKVIHK